MPNARLQALVYGAVLALIIGWVLYIGRDVFVPVVLGVLVVYVIVGLTRLLGRLPYVGRRLPDKLAYALSMLLIGAGFAAAVSLAIGNMDGVIARGPLYQESLLASIQQLAVWLGVETEPTWISLRQDLLAQINLQRVIGSTVVSVTSILVSFVVVVLYASFLLLELRHFPAKLAGLSDDPQRVARIRQVTHDINARIGSYLALKTVLSLLLGAICWVIMTLMGLEFALFWAVLIALLNFVPYIGSFLGVALPVAMAIVQFADLNTVGDADDLPVRRPVRDRQFPRPVRDGQQPQPQPVRDSGEPDDLVGAVGHSRRVPGGADHVDIDHRPVRIPGNATGRRAAFTRRPRVARPGGDAAATRYGAGTTFAPTSLSKRWNSGDVHDDRPRRGAQSIDGLGGQHKRRGLLIQVIEFRLVLQRRERHVDGIDLGVRDAQQLRQSRDPCWSPSPPSPGSGAGSATVPPCPSAVRPPRTNNGRSARRPTSAECRWCLAVLSVSSQLVGGEDRELTTKTMILRALSSRVGTPACCSASRTSSASSTPRIPTLSETPPSTRWM